MVPKQPRSGVRKITTFIVAKTTASFASMSETLHQAQDDLGRSWKETYDVYAHSNRPLRVRCGKRLRRSLRRRSSCICRGCHTEPGSGWSAPTHSHDGWQQAHHRVL